MHEGIRNYASKDCCFCELRECVGVDGAAIVDSMVKPKLAVPTSKASHDAERVPSKTMVTYRCSVPAAASNLGIVREPTHTHEPVLRNNWRKSSDEGGYSMIQNCSKRYRQSEGSLERTKIWKQRQVAKNM